MLFALFFLVLISTWLVLIIMNDSDKSVTILLMFFQNSRVCTYLLKQNKQRIIIPNSLFTLLNLFSNAHSNFFLILKIIFIRVKKKTHVWRSYLSFLYFECCYLRKQTFALYNDRMLILNKANFTLDFIFVCFTKNTYFFGFSLLSTKIQSSKCSTTYKHTQKRAKVYRPAFLSFF